MKKFNSILFCAVAAFAVASCNKEAQELPGAKSDLIPMTFTATTTETRTVLGEDHVSIKWLSTDKISVFDGDGNKEFTSDGEGTTVHFNGNAVQVAQYYALYPYDANATLSNGAVTTTLPAVQTAVKGTFLNGVNINAAQADNTTFVFDNVVSVAKLTIDNTKLGGKTIRAIKLASTNYALAGDVNVAFGTPCVATPGTSTVQEVILDGGTSGFADGVYYFVVLPNQGGEIKLTFLATDGAVATKTATLGSSFSAGTIKNLGTVSGLTWTSAVWKLVTDASTLRAGDKLVIASSSKNKVATTFNSKYLNAVAVTISSDKSTISSLPSDAMQFTLDGASSAWTLTSESGQLYADGSDLNFSSKGAGTWTITIASGDATIASTTSSNGRFLYNVTSPRFKTYGSGTQLSQNMILPQLYRQEGEEQFEIPSSSVAAPTFDPVAGTYADAQTVTISSTTANASIFYTTGNSDFSAGDWTAYSAPVNVAESCTLKAIAVCGGVVSAVSSASYQIGTEDHTATIQFGTNNVKINTASVTGNDNQGNTWTISTVGTNSYNPQPSYCQVGSKDDPATSITFTTTFSSSALVKSISAKFGGFNGTAGTINLKVGDNVIGTGGLNGSSDVTVSSSSTANGTVLTVTVTNISKGVKVYNISVTYNN